MTIGQKRRHNSVTMRKSFMISDNQEAKKHAAAQRLLFQMSDVLSELHNKKQQAASRKDRASELQNKKQRICADAYDQPHMRCRQRNKVIEEAAFVNQENVVSMDSMKEGGNADADFNHLLMLANSVDLLESEGQFHVDKSLDDTHQIGGVVVERADFRIQGKVRLTHIRRRARLGNPQREHAHFERLEDAHGGSRVEVDQVQDVIHHQNIQDPRVVNERGSEGIEDIRKEACVEKLKTINTDDMRESSVNEPRNINNRNLQQSSTTTHVIALQPVQRDSEFGDLGEQDNGGHPLTEAGTAKISSSEENKLSELQQPALELPVPQAVQMTSELGHCREQQISAHQLTKFRIAQISPSKEDNVNENLQQLPAEPHVCIGQPVQMTPEQDSGAHLLTEVGSSRMSLLIDKFLNTQPGHGHTPLNIPTECSPSTIQMSEVVKSCPTARRKGKSKRPPVVLMPKVMKDDPSVAYRRRVKRITKGRKKPVQKLEGLKDNLSVARHRRMLRMTKRRKKAVQGTSELGELKEHGSSVHLLTEVGNSKRSPSIEKNVNPLIQVSEDLKDVPSSTRHKRTQRIIQRRKQRHGVQLLSTANIHTRPVFQGHHWGLWRVVNEQQYERSHIEKQHWPSNVSHAGMEQHCLTTQQKGAERIEHQRAPKTSLQQSNTPQPMEQNHLEEWVHNSRMALGSEQVPLSLKVNQSLQYHCNSEICEDLCDELQQRITNVQTENRTSSVKRKMRLTQLKREARLRYSSLQMKN